MSSVEIPKANPFIYESSRVILGIFFSLYFRYRAIGTENIPISGPLLVIGNHVSSIDWLTIMYAFKNQRMTWVVKKEAIDDPRTGIYFRLGGAIQVDRDVLDIKTAKIVIEYLRRGGILGIMPEGTRSLDGGIHDFKPGFIKLALLTKTPILPTTVLGIFEALPKGRIFPKRTQVTVKFGKIITFDEHYGKRLNEDEIRNLADLVKSRIIELHEP